MTRSEQRTIGTALAIMTRAPVAGETKTRLQAAVGRKNAAALAETFFLDTLAKPRQVRDLNPVVLVAGDVAHPAFSDLELRVIPQQGAELGARIEHALRFGLEQHRAALVVGSDSPSLPPSYLAQAVSCLRESISAGNAKRAVVGPATDGGFYLLGVTDCETGLLKDVGWSESTTCTQTVCALSRAGFSIAHLPPWYDVDEPAELTLLRAHLQRRPRAAERTATLLKQWRSARA